MVVGLMLGLLWVSGVGCVLSLGFVVVRICIGSLEFWLGGALWCSLVCSLFVLI